MTTTTDALGTYLNDHLGGASAGVEMARRLQKEVRGQDDAAALGMLAEEIEEDRQTLARLVEGLGTGTNPVKQGAGWLAEKIQRLGVDEKLTGSAYLSRLLQVESLSLGVEGKLCLWLTLMEIVPAHPSLADLDLPGLAEQARDQRRRLETVRLSVGRRTFSTVG